GRGCATAPAAGIAEPAMRSKLAAALAFRQRRVVLKAISLAVDRLLDWALSGFCLLTLIISGGRSIIRRVRRVRGDDGTGEKQQNQTCQQWNGLSHVRRTRQDSNL